MKPDAIELLLLYAKYRHAQGDIKLIEQELRIVSLVYFCNHGKFPDEV